jgi:Ca-activated chloride channel family protein
VIAKARVDSEALASLPSATIMGKDKQDRRAMMAVNAFRRTASAFLSLTIALSAASMSRAEDSLIGCNQDAMLVFDASGSMASMGYNGLDVPRIFEARDALRNVLPQVTPFRNLGLVIYGPGPRDACSNIDLRLEPKPDAAAAILAEVDQVQPEGKTPLTRAVDLAADVLNSDERPGVIVLVTDGRETCGGAPCALAEQLLESSPDLTVHVIGFKIRGETYDPARFEDGGFEKGGYTVAQCLADQTGGLYVHAETTDELANALQETLGCALLSDALNDRQADRS